MTMFDFLKKKISGFIEKFTKKEEEKLPEEKPLEIKESVPIVTKIPSGKEIPSEKEITIEPEIPATQKPVEIKLQEKAKPISPVEIKERAPLPKEIPKEEVKPAAASEPPLQKKETAKPAPAVKIPKPEISKPKEEEKPVLKKELPPAIPKTKIPEKPVAEKPKEELSVISESKPSKPREIKTGILSAIKSLVTGEIEIQKEEVAPLLEEFELELLESDVALEVADQVRKELYVRLVGTKIKRGQVSHFVKQTMEDALVGMLENKNQFDFVERITQNPRPVRIMFLGPNGAGKTTSMAKIAHLLQRHGLKVVFAAGDTFRAAAIEQLGIHAGRLGVPIIKRPYGSDATAVAYDAVSYARAHGIEVVLIDTAGRQDTNVNLLNELKKMQRVIQPQLKIYIGESIAGNALLEQVKTFHRELGVDGVILTKLDCDPKGGTMLSVSRATGLPILYVGIGQGYEDLEAYDAQKMVKRILS